MPPVVLSNYLITGRRATTYRGIIVFLDPTFGSLPRHHYLQHARNARSAAVNNFALRLTLPYLGPIQCIVVDSSRSD